MTEVVKSSNVVIVVLDGKSLKTVMGAQRDIRCCSQWRLLWVKLRLPFKTYRKASLSWPSWYRP